MTALEIFNPLLNLFEYIFNVFATFGEIASTRWGDIVNSLEPNAERLVYEIFNPFSNSVFSFKLTFGQIGNGVVNVITGLADLINAILPFGVPTSDLPLYAVILILTIPFSILFFLITIISKFF